MKKKLVGCLLANSQLPDGHQIAYRWPANNWQVSSAGCSFKITQHFENVAELLREGEAILRACEPEPEPEPEPRASSREPRASSLEPRASSREPLFVSLKRIPPKNPKTGIMP